METSQIIGLGILGVSGYLLLNSFSNEEQTIFGGGGSSGTTGTTGTVAPNENVGKSTDASGGTTYYTYNIPSPDLSAFTTTQIPTQTPTTKKEAKSREGYGVSTSAGEGRLFFDDSGKKLVGVEDPYSQMSRLATPEEQRTGKVQWGSTGATPVTKKEEKRTFTPITAISILSQAISPINVLGRLFK